MTYVLTNLAEKLYEAKFTIDSLQSINVETAKEQFNEYKNHGVIISGEFDDNVWQTSDEYSHVGLHFNFDEASYNFYYRKIFEITYSDFLTYTKIFILYLFGNAVLRSLQVALNDLKRLIRTHPDEVALDNPNCPTFYQSAYCVDFITMLPESYNTRRDQLVKSLDVLAENASDNPNDQRVLSQFESYLLFGQIMKDYWSRDLPAEERMFYYPLYLWWRFTAVIPERPREFILTERNCLQYSGDDIFLILRKNKLKGSNRSVSYKIDEDYTKVRYKITKELADEIEKYKAFTKKFDSTDIDTLFVTDPHYYKWGQKKHSNSRYLTYINLTTILRYFYQEVVHGIYGKKVLHYHKETHLVDNEIEMIRLGDARHISMINIIKDGGSPVVAMMLAGHSSIEMSANYFSNVKNLIECSTYTQYMLSLPNKGSYSSSLPQYFPSDMKEKVQINEFTNCFSEKVLAGNFEDCLKAIGPNGEIGYCKACRIAENQDSFSIENMYLKRMEEDCKLLADTVKTVRGHKGNYEDIGEKILKLKSSAYSYQRFCEAKMQKEIIENGKKESN